MLAANPLRTHAGSIGRTVARRARAAPGVPAPVAVRGSRRGFGLHPSAGSRALLGCGGLEERAVGCAMAARVELAFPEGESVLEPGVALVLAFEAQRRGDLPDSILRRRAFRIA